MRNIERKWFIKIPEGETVDIHQEIKDTIKALDDETNIQIIDCHQTILNIGYNWWQKSSEDPERTKKSIDYKDMIDYISETYGEIYAGLILIGKYNQQVTNGGHFQYYDNGYADGVGGCMNEHDFNHPMHGRLVKWLKTLITNIETNHLNSSILSKLKELLIVLDNFYKIDIDTEEEITEREWIHDTDDEEDDGHWEDVEISNDEYGRMNYEHSKGFDEEYFKISEDVMDIMEDISSILLGLKTVEELKTLIGESK